MDRENEKLKKMMIGDKAYVINMPEEIKISYGDEKTGEVWNACLR